MPENIQYKLMLPVELDQWVKSEAQKGFRSKSAQIVLVLTERMSAATGEGLANTAPAAAPNNNAARQGDASINHGN